MARRDLAAPQTVVVVRDPPSSVVARLRELQGSYPSAEFKVGSCERP